LRREIKRMEDQSLELTNEKIQLKRVIEGLNQKLKESV
jgi:hypothetical protein